MLRGLGGAARGQERRARGGAARVEDCAPAARTEDAANAWEKQSSVNYFHMIYLIFFSWQDRIIAFLAGKGSNSLTFELTVSSTLGFGLQSLIIMVMAITTQLIYLPELILGVNFVLMAVVLLRSYL